MAAKSPKKPGDFRVDHSDLPLGIERVLYLAATEPDFAEALMKDRTEAISNRGVVLRPSERALLEALPEDLLRANISAVDPSPPNVERRTFLRAAALTSATVAVGRGAVGGCERDANASPLRQLAAQHAGGPLERAGTTGFYLEVKDRGLLQRLTVFLEVEAHHPRLLEVDLTTPSGAVFTIVDGEQSQGVSARGLRGWYGSDGLATVESLAALSDSPVFGQWLLTIRSPDQGKLIRWRMAGQVSDESMRGSFSTYGEYAGYPAAGCDCKM